MTSDDKSSVKSSNLDDLIDNLISDEELERYIAEQNDGLTREEREKLKEKIVLTQLTSGAPKTLAETQQEQKIKPLNSSP
ncbi:hypothetical protein P4S56_18530 [Pseudoalteromonas sp. Hal056]|uniref:hypothetical protein n=1 Tax=Pseudoalteromonas sp. Hal056 TaxID=3035159 RepID=UPI00301D660C